MRRDLFILILPFLVHASLSYGLELEEQSPDGVYKSTDQTLAVRFIPPKGWEAMPGYAESPSGFMHVEFVSSQLSGASIGIAVTPAPVKGAAEAQLLNSLKESVETDQAILEKEFVEFGGVKAFVSVSVFTGMKTKQIQFFKAGKLVTLSFVADEGDFPRLLPAVEESFKTFDLISPASSNFTTEPVSVGEGSLSPSEKLFKLFQEIADRVSLDSLKEAQKSGVLPQLREMDEVSLQELARQGGAQLMEKFKDAFVVSDPEAQKMLQGQYNDAENMKVIREAITRFSNLSVLLPVPIQYLVEKYHRSLRGEPFSSLEAEFTARLFSGYLRQNQSRR